MNKKILIGGEWREASESFPVRSPYTNKPLAEVFSANAAETAEAIALADDAAREMRKLARFEIAKGLRRIAEGIENRKKEFAETIANEAAKPISLARGEVERGISTFAFAAGEAERFVGEVVPVDVAPNGKGKTAFTKRIPRGVIYGITPFNFPLNLVAHKVAPALAAGNAIIIKPSQRTPLTSLLLGEVFIESGLPKSALQIVPMDVKYMDAVLADDRVNMISFTGSAAVRRNTSYPSYEVIVVDNHSKDGSPEELKRLAETDPRIQIYCLEENLGFAGGNNFAARMAKGEYLVLLNPDTILTAGWLERLIRPLEQDPATGLVAPVTNFSGNETKINTSYSSLVEMEEFAAQCAEVRRGESFAIDVIPLFCGLLRRKLWDEIGGLDVSFKVGMFEDDDFSLRVRKAGYRIVTAEDCFIHHFGNGSFGKLESEAFLQIFNENKKRFESKWSVMWRPHRTRPGVRPVSAENRITLSKFLAGDGASGS